MKAYNFEYGVVASRPDQMYGWPGICKVKGQEILVAASERKYHICPFGREVVIRSFDGGRTWELPQEVYNSELDDRDSNLAILPDGTIVLTWFTSIAWEYYIHPEWKPRVERVTQRMREELLGTWLLRSFDGGHTWETTPHRVPTGAHAGPTVLSNGSLIYLGEIKTGDECEMASFISTDKGISWRKAGIVPFPKNIELNENHVMEVSPGRLIALFREETEGYLYQSNSEDYGVTWSPVVRLPVWGYPPYLLLLQSGVLLCLYGHRREPWSIRAVLSYDYGRTWDVDNIITIYGWRDKPDMGYPVAVELEPGQILTVFYCSRQDIRYEQRIKGLTPDKGLTPEGLLYARFMLK